MDRKIAEKLMVEIESLNQVTNRQAHLIELISDENERKIFRRAIGTVMIDAYDKLMRPVIRQFPELDPDRE